MPPTPAGAVVKDSGDVVRLHRPHHALGYLTPAQYLAQRQTSGATPNV